MHPPEKVRKYLSKQYLNKWKIYPYNLTLFKNIIIIPALDELANLKLLLDSISQNELIYLRKTLILIVVNNIKGTSRYIYTGNNETIKFLKDKISQSKDKFNIGYIDASSPGLELPEKHAGVGMARKIGMDLALEHFDYSNPSPNLLICLDADCTVNRIYLKSIISQFDKNSLHSATAIFEHPMTDDKNVNEAIVNYEIFLRYYVLGLIYAKSKFAHLSVGSTIVCDVESYVKVGGMNKRKGGEDFYLLNELAKITEIAKISGAIVYPSSRISERVPFGTGPRIKRFISGSHDEYELYSPKTFELLKSWLEIYYQYLKDDNSISETIEKMKKINPGISQFLISQKFEKDWNNILKNSRSKSQIDKQKLIWMDGFRTLKMIHYLRDKGYKNISMFDAVDILLKKNNIFNQIKRSSKIPEFEVQIEYLDILREITNRNL